MNAYVEDLFSYLERFETRPDEFDTEAFLQTYNGVYTVFEALTKQRDKAIELDHFFVDKIKQIAPSKSGLRLLTIQLLISFFEAEADIDGQSNKGYLYCRSLREIKQDVPYFERHLIPMLFNDAGLTGNVKLHRFFLDEIARYLNKYGSRLDGDLTPETFDGLSDPMKFLVLARRRLLIGTDLLKDRSSLEFHLLQVKAFPKLAAKHKTHREHLSEWKYLQTDSFWTKLTGWFGEFTGKLGGAFSSWKYFRLVIRQRNAAYLTYTIIMILSILLAIYVPMKWTSYSGDKLQGLEDHATELQQGN